MKHLATDNDHYTERATEIIKLLNCMLRNLQSVCLTAKSRDFDFLSYLTEMAVLEAQREIYKAEMDGKAPQVLHQRNASAEMPFKARC